MYSLFIIAERGEKRKKVKKKIAQEKGTQTGKNLQPEKKQMIE